MLQLWKTFDRSDKFKNEPVIRSAGVGDNFLDYWAIYCTGEYISG
jgi:hypothetical protein